MFHLCFNVCYLFCVQVVTAFSFKKHFIHVVVLLQEYEENDDDDMVDSGFDG